MVGVELRKLRRPLAGVAALAFLLSVANSWNGLRHGLQAEHRRERALEVDPCRSFGLRPGEPCDGLLRQATRDVPSGDERRRSLRAREDAVAVLSHPLGAGRLAARTAASLPGHLFLLLLGALSTGARSPCRLWAWPTWAARGSLSEEVGVGFVLVVGLVAAGLLFALPIWTVIDALRYPESIWAESGQSRTVWLVLMIVVPVVGPVLYLALVRGRLPATMG